MNARNAAAVLAIACLAGCQAYDPILYHRLVDAHGDARDAVAETTASSCATTCATEEGCCGGTCTDLTINADHCGSCNTMCPGTTCSGGICTSACRLGRLDCDHNVVNGCEIDASSNAANCGACGHACPANSSCVEGQCTTPMACPAGQGDCDGNTANGCESNLNTDAHHCGTCATVCSFGHAATQCSNGTCALGTCTDGYGNCDSVATNGCESEFSSNSMHCGTCATACSPGTQCSGGTCVAACAAGTADCDHVASTACEVNTNTDATNCGSCANACPAGQTCSAGVCQGAGDSAQYGFETGVQGWTIDDDSNATLPGIATSTMHPFAGSHSCAATITATITGGVSALRYVRVPGPPTPASATVTFHVWIPADAPVEFFQPYALQGESGGWAWTGNYTDASNTVFGGWNESELIVPSNAVTPMDSIGVQFSFNANWTGTVYIDSISW